MRRGLALGLAIWILLSGVGVAEVQTYDAQAMIDAEVAFILSCRHASGAILNRPICEAEKTQTYNPYFACQAMLGLVAARRELDTVRAYIEFHLNKLNTLDSDGLEGSIYDYTATANCLMPTYNYDSTDSYAALALILIDEYIKATGDTSVAQNRVEDINALGYAMVATLDEGLTFARPNYPVKYLMDNCEVYQGHLAAASIYESALGRSDMAESHRFYAEEIRSRIMEVYWLSNVGLFAASVQDRTVVMPDWTVFYPDAAAQLIPGLTGVMPKDDPRTGALWASFLAHQPRWADAALQDGYVWALIAKTALLQHDQMTLDGFLQTVWDAYGAGERAAPWYCGESGAMLEVLSALPQK